MRRHPFILAALAGALALTACGGDEPTAQSASSRQDEAFEGALQFAKCMREHGVDVPDPTRDSNGRVTMQARRSTGAAPDDAKAKEAQEACGEHLRGGGERKLDPERQAELQDAFLAYARCMRGEGIDMPDPSFDGGGVIMRVGKEGGRSDLDPESPKFTAADETCHHHLDDVEREMAP
jgi:hypothetical protein